MTNVIVVFQKIEDAKSIRNLLVRNGFTVVAMCTTGAQAINYADRLNEGIVVCGAKLPDMTYSQLCEYLPQNVEMLLVASQRFWSECNYKDLVCLTMPLNIHDLVDTIEMMTESIAKRRKKKKEMPVKRNEEEKQWIAQAKALLMERNSMSEEEAYRYIQKNSMDSGTNMVETAQMIITLMR